MDPRICLQLCLLQAGQRTIPFDVFNDLWGVTVHFNPQNVFIFRRFASWGCYVHCLSRSPERKFLMLLGSPALLMIAFSIRKGERREISFPSTSEGMMRTLGT